MKPELRFTRVAGQAMDFATAFNAFFVAGVEGRVHHKLDLTTPAGPSTEGGKLALQHVRLVPADGGAAIVVGSVNSAQKTAELRTYAALSELHARRFKGAELPIPLAAFDAVARDLKNFFTARGFAVTIVDAQQTAAARPASGGGSGARIIGILGLVTLAVALGTALWFFWLRPRGIL